MYHLSQHSKLSASRIILHSSSLLSSFKSSLTICSSIRLLHSQKHLQSPAMQLATADTTDNDDHSSASSSHFPYSVPTSTVQWNDRHMLDQVRPLLYILLVRARSKEQLQRDWISDNDLDQVVYSLLQQCRQQGREPTKHELARAAFQQIEQHIQQAEQDSLRLNAMMSLNQEERAQKLKQYQRDVAGIETTKTVNDDSTQTLSSADSTLISSSLNLETDNSTDSTNSDSTTTTTQSTQQTPTLSPDIASILHQVYESSDVISNETLIEMLNHCKPEEFKLFEEQLQFETQALKTAVDRYQKMSETMVKMQKGAALKSAQSLLLSWYNPLVAAIEIELQAIKSQEVSKDRSVYGPYLSELTAPELACIVMHEMFSLSLIHPSGVAFTHAAQSVGKSVNMQVKLNRTKENKQLWRRMMEGLTPGQATVSAPEILRRARNIKTNTWSDPIIVKVGSCLLSILMNTATIPDSSSNNKNLRHPAFRHDYSRKSSASHSHHSSSSSPVARSSHNNFSITGMIVCHERVLNVVLRDHDVFEALAPRFLPMLTKPKPWTSYDVGGYISVTNKIIRSHGSQQQLDAVKRADLRCIFEGLNYLSSIPWRVNHNVLNVINQLWDLGGGVADIPSQTDHILPDPQPDRKDKVQYQAYMKLRRENANLHSLRCNFHYKVQVAQKFLNRSFYFPFNLDFRGRAYPIPPHLNHMGDDLCRGLLLFSDGCALGEHGLRWIKIQIASLYAVGGVDKLSFDARVKWAEEKEPEIRAVVQDAVKNRFWLQAEDPFQFLATCYEYIAAIDSPDPTKFISHLPIHQDGSCNGLQHYAALGRDYWGGSCVNLVDATEPQDVYSGVLKRVNERLEEDSQDTVNKPFAALLKGKINRKIVKQTVMTSVYGVTNIGARDQILARLQERADIVEVMPEPVDQSLSKAAMYLAQTTLSSLYDAFAGARRIQTWFEDCAQVMGQLKQPVSWITPLGLPVIQPYRRARNYQVDTVVQQVTIADHSDLLPVSGTRQKSAFPPNFVHSLDASHMLLTALDCKQRGITYTAVHDSYWTHAGTMNELSESLRSQFVSLYNRPILEDLREQWVQRFPELKFKPLPARGDLKMEEVLKSTYFFN